MYKLDDIENSLGQNVSSEIAKPVDVLGQNVLSVDDLGQNVASLGTIPIRGVQKTFNNEPKVMGIDFLYPEPGKIAKIPNESRRVEPSLVGIGKITTRFLNSTAKFKLETTPYVPDGALRILDTSHSETPRIERMLEGAGLQDITQVHPLYKNQIAKAVTEKNVSDKSHNEVVSTQLLSGVGRTEFPHKPYRPG